MEKSAKIIIALAILTAIGIFSFNKLSGWHQEKLETTVQRERQVWRAKMEKLQEQVTELQEELINYKGSQLPEKKLTEVFGPAAEKKVVQDTQPANFVEIENKIAAFFSYLDDQQYTQASNLSGGAYQQYLITLKKLSSNLPIITGEMHSLYNLMRNVAHFYRALGKKRVLLVKQILKNESAVIEPAMKNFYLWFTMDDGGKATLRGRPSLEVLYEYAGYLLNTMAGRSYLLRRNLKLRTLTIYYCVLILDRANDEELNSRGIDIRPYIRSSLNDIQNQIGLTYQAEYIENLNELIVKYQVTL